MTRKIRLVFALLALGAALAACGHYGPPSHPEPAREQTAAPAPAEPAAPSEPPAPAGQPERERHEP
jgi:predicted small lipoprotein YifL